MRSGTAGSSEPRHLKATARSPPRTTTQTGIPCGLDLHSAIACSGMSHNRISSRRNERMTRITTAWILEQLSYGKHVFLPGLLFPRRHRKHRLNRPRRLHSPASLSSPPSAILVLVMLRPLPSWSLSWWSRGNWTSSSSWHDENQANFHRSAIERSTKAR